MFDYEEGVRNIVKGLVVGYLVEKFGYWIYVFGMFILIWYDVDNK